MSTDTQNETAQAPSLQPVADDKNLLNPQATSCCGGSSCGSNA